jgi:hypothetical protein
MLYGPVSGYQSFGGTYSLHLQGRSVRRFLQNVCNHVKSSRRRTPEDENQHLVRSENIKAKIDKLKMNYGGMSGEERKCITAIKGCKLPKNAMRKQRFPLQYSFQLLYRRPCYSRTLSSGYSPRRITQPSTERRILSADVGNGNGGEHSLLHVLLTNYYLYCDT